jgi:hypothetical protein
MAFYPLKGFNHVFEASYSNEIKDALVEYFDWGLLEKGNYFNVTRGELAPNGQDYSRLKLGDDPNYPSGCVWEGFRKNWIWQSGITGVAGHANPIVGTDNTHPGISGVYINGAYKPITSTGTYAHFIDYYNGRVVFSNPLPTGSLVQAEFSYKWINVLYANDVPWLRQIQLNSNEPANNNVVTMNPLMRVQLPAIAVEVVPRRTFRGYQLGGGQYVYTDVLFHVFAEDVETRNKLVDIVSFQNDKQVFTFDSNRIALSGTFPIDYRGVPVSGAMRYPDVISGYFGGWINLTKTTLQHLQSYGEFFGGIVRTTTEGIKTNI